MALRVDDEVLGPLESLASKSEKAQRKLAPGTWQHAMLEANLAALRIALALLAPGPPARRPTRKDLEGARRALADMADRTKAALATFAPGTAQHSLQRNRLKALLAAKAAVDLAVRGRRTSSHPRRVG